MKSRFIIALSMLFATLQGSAKTLNPEDYIFPLKGVAGLYSANFGEFRPDHFHSGIDIKTDGVVGKSVVAIADGFISRISLSPYGYGLALYVAHPNGTTSVYGHLSKFMEPVAEYIEAERYRTKQHTLNLFCTPKQFPVKQGDVIALSGNSGGSFGPHLHFEIRDSATQDPINMVAQGVIKPKDDIAPLIMKVHYIELDTVQGIARQAKPRSYSVVKGSDGYTIAGGGDVAVGRQGYFVIEASDRRCDVTNTFGIYHLTALVDGEKYFEYKMDRFSYSNTRYCNAISYYPIMINSRNEVLRLAATELSDMSHYTKIANRGVITTAPDEKRSVKIKVADDIGNVSQLNFSIIGKSDADLFHAAEVDQAMIISPKRSFTFSRDGVSLSLPSHALYESTVFSYEMRESQDSLVFSKVYKVLSVDTPLHKAMDISIVADVPYDLQNKVGIVCVSRSGRPSFITGKYRLGSVYVSSKNAGEFYVMADTKPPVLSVGIAEGSQQAGSSYFTCRITDDLSGVESYSATLNGQWIALNLDKGVMRHNFRSKPTGANHTLVIIATDAVGNQTKLVRNFTR